MFRPRSASCGIKNFQRTLFPPSLEIRTRPAIVTSIEPENRHLGPANAPVRQVLNLHVFFEDRDFITDRQRDVVALGLLRRNVTKPVAPSWQIPELR